MMFKSKALGDGLFGGVRFAPVRRFAAGLKILVALQTLGAECRRKGGPPKVTFWHPIKSLSVRKPEFIKDKPCNPPQWPVAL
jgi:hypothetical protein